MWAVSLLLLLLLTLPFSVQRKGISLVWNGLRQPSLDIQPFPPAAAAMDYTSLGLQLGDRGNQQIKEIPLSIGTLLAFRYKFDGDFEQE